MKYHFLITSALTTLCLLTSHHSLAIPAEKDPARWFEIEVILFKQVSNKSQEKEQYIARDLSAKKRRAFDLLAPYLQPDIASLKQLLPNCEQPSYESPYKIELAPLNFLQTDNFTGIAVLPEDNSQEYPVENEPKQSENIDSTEPGSMSVVVLDTVSESFDNSVDDSNEFAVVSIEEAAEEKVEATSESADIAIEQVYEYATIEVPVYNQYPSDSKAPLCVIPMETFQQRLSSVELEDFNIDGFPVDKLTTTIDGIEQWRDDKDGEITWASDQPYLISKDSLKLKSIANRIKRNRSYTPMLHLGWRQIGETRRKAKAMNLYAGEHLNLDYQQALAQQDSEQQALEVKAILEQRKQAEQQILSQLTLANNEEQIAVEGNLQENIQYSQSEASDNVVVNTIKSAEENDIGSDIQDSEVVEAISELSITQQLRQQAKQQEIDNIYQQFTQLKAKELQGTESNKELNYSEQEISDIVGQLASQLHKPDSQLNMLGVTENQMPLAEPIQPWSIDGLFKVHLDHYLYINSELNIIEPSKSAASTTANTDQNKVISFKQDRRVITGEIHYFDHPHIGMIVQIRRFDPTKPADEAVSQSKK